MTKDVGDGKKTSTISPIILTVVAAILAISLTIFLVWVILQPHKPHFIIQDATLYAFNLSSTYPNLLTSNLQVTIYTKNPNHRIGIFYHKLDIFASYRNQRVTLATSLPQTYLGRRDFTIWSPFLYGNAVPVAPYIGGALTQDLSAGTVLLEIKIQGKLKWKVGSWWSGKYHVNVNCPAFLVVAGGGGGGGKSFGVNSDGSFTALKYQLVQNCVVDI